MNFVIVADDPGRCTPRVPGLAVVPARAYLLDPDWRTRRGLRVVNLCRTAYQRYGYYVSLLAEARDHRPLPGIAVLKDVEPARPLRLLTMSLQRRFDQRPRRRHGAPLALAILQDPANRFPASNDAAIGKFAAAGQALGLRVERLGQHDIGRLAEFDGLFIRDNTFIRHYTYRFARRAADLGLTVIDDPLSILRCNNKVFLAELLPRHGIPVPRSMIVDRGNLARVVPALGLPCVLKRPDSSLSLGVVRVESAAELHATGHDMLRESDLIVAQEYLPTPFDWRVGVLDGRALFVCKYHMLPGHWQIVRHVADDGHYEEGATEALGLDAAPAAALELALRAARLMGDGFYGVDIKETAPGELRVIEVNDNPNVDAGNEDTMLRDQLYAEVMRVFARRMAARRECRP